MLLAGLGGSLTNFGGVWLADRNAYRLIRDWVPARTHQDLMDDLYGVMSCPRADDDRDGDHLAASLGWLVCLRRDGAAASVAMISVSLEPERIAAVTARLAGRAEQVIALQEVSGDQLASLRAGRAARTVHAFRYPRVPVPHRGACPLPRQRFPGL